MTKLNKLSNDLSKCEKQMKKQKTKKFMLHMADNLTVCLGVVSGFCIFVSPYAAIPFATLIGVGMYINKKEEENDFIIRNIYTYQTKLKTEIFKELKKYKKENNLKEKNEENNITENKENSIVENNEELYTNTIENKSIANNKNKVLVKKIGK